MFVTQGSRKEAYTRDVIFSQCNLNFLSLLREHNSHRYAALDGSLRFFVDATFS